MPPRYAYWTIIVDNQPTAFRAGAQEDLMPTFKRLKEKHPSATMQWFQNGKLWPSRLDAQEAMRARGEMGRRGDAKQGGGFRDRKREFSRSAQDSKPRASEKLEWKPRGEFIPAPKRADRPDWKPKSSSSQGPRTPRPQARAYRPEKPEWKPKGSPDRDRKPEWKPKTSRPQDFKTSRSPRLEWKPKGTSSQADSGPPRPGDKRDGAPEKRKWIPKQEYKKAMGIDTPRDSKWRPGGEHRDPRQKYKDAKKAKWSKFKKTIRTRWESKAKKKS